MATPIIDSKLNRAILTVSVAKTLTAVVQNETSGIFYADGVSIGAATNSSGDNWTLAWTPAAVASSVSITFVGAVNGSSDPTILTVSRAATINQNMSTWSGNAQGQVASGITHPDGVGTVYQGNPYSAGTLALWIAKTATTANAIANSAFEVWMAVPASSVLRCVQFNFSLGGGYFNYDTEETTAGDCYIKVVERRDVGGLIWKRVQCRRTDLAPGGIGSSMFLYMTKDFTSTSTTISAGELSTAKIYFCEPKMVGDVPLPFTPYMKLSWHKHIANTASLGVAGGEEWNYKHPYCDTESNMSGGAYPGGLLVRTIKPTGWTATGNYPCVFFLPALSESGETSAGNATAWEAAKDSAADYANTYNCVVIVPQERGNVCWWGRYSTGFRNLADLLPYVFLPWLIEFFGVSPNKNDHILIGYSKSGNAAVSQILLYPQSWGFAASWDGAFLNNWPDNVASAGWDNSTEYAKYDPKQILSANLGSVNDNKRLVIYWGSVWQADNISFTNQLTAAGVPYSSDYTYQATHAWGPTGINGSWTPNMVAKMFETRLKVINRQYLMFFA